MDKVLKFLKEDVKSTYDLCTIDAEGKPQCRPFGTITKFEDKLYVQTGMIKNVYKEIEANPNICIHAFDPNSGIWLRLNATAVIDKRDEASAAAIEDYPMLEHKYAPGDGNCVVFYLKDATARFCSFTAPEEVHTF